MRLWPLGVTLAAIALTHLVIPWIPLAELNRMSPDTAWLLLTEIRLPRTLLALGYGAVLGITGAALQALFANPLASPDITGSSSGAALGAVCASKGAADPPRTVPTINSAPVRRLISFDPEITRPRLFVRKVHGALRRQARLLPCPNHSSQSSAEGCPKARAMPNR
jgi:predicted lysophospholipase L1 biosynthesis ABC-type transport system permease subunit